MVDFTLDFKTKGIKEAQQRLNMLSSRFPNEIEAAIKTELELVMTESKKEVPVDTGALRNSGYVSSPYTTGSKITIKIEFVKCQY